MRWIIILVLLACNTVLAAPKYTPRIIPKCEVKKLGDGTEVCAYTLKQVKKLYEADSALFHLVTDHKKLEYKADLLKAVVKKKDEQLDLSLRNTKIYETRAAELTKQLLETDRKYQLERVKPRWGSYVLWVVAISTTAAFTGYVIADQVSK